MRSLRGATIGRLIGFVAAVLVWLVAFGQPVLASVVAPVDGCCLPAPRPGVLVEGAGSGTRTINFWPNAADPNWGLTQTHLDKHLFGSGPHSLSTIDSAGNPALWTDYIQDLAGRRVTSTTSNGMQDIIGTFPLADGSGTFQFGIRLSPNTDETFDLITLLTRQ